MSTNNRWLHRQGNTVVTWKNATIIWGGEVENEISCPSLVVCHLSGRWIQKQTSGDIPTHSLDSVATVLNDKMFVLGGVDKHEVHVDGNVIYFLDLNEWTWTRLIPEGTPPAKQTMSSSSWVYQGNIYTFGSHNRNTQEGLDIFCYNVSKNHWSQPHARGEIPSDRFGQTTIINKGTVFLFGGGSCCHNAKNDLYTLDMQDLRWKMVHGHLTGKAYQSVLPKTRIAHTMTWINQYSAVVHGGLSPRGYNDPRGLEVLEDSWILNLNKAKELQEPSLIWTQIKQGSGVAKHPRGRYGHAAVLEPASLRLWLIGGAAGSSQAIDKVSFNVLPMRLRAIESIIGCIKGDDPRLGPGELPEQLRKEIEAYRIGGEEEKVHNTGESFQM